MIFIFFAAAVSMLDDMNFIPKKWMRSRRAHRWTAGKDKDKVE